MCRTWTVKCRRVLVVICICVLRVVSSQCDGFTHQPVDQWKPEGVSATFSCRHPYATAGVGWLINGTGTNEIDPLPMGISTDFNVLTNGSRVDTMTIQALSEYNGTVIGCLATFLNRSWCMVNGTLWIIAPPRPVDNLQLHPTATELTLTWDHFPLNTVNYSIRFCVDVYRVVDGVKVLVHSECGVSWSSYVFIGTAASDLDPSNLFEFVVTPVYDVSGARNGSSRGISGYFTGAPSAIAPDSVNVGVMISRDLVVTLNITIRNAMSWIVGGQILVNVSLGFKDQSHSYICSSGDPVVTASWTLSLYTCCTNLPIERDGNITVVARNGVESTYITKPLSTHFIQGISAVPCGTSQCQLEITYDVVADVEIALGSLIMLYGGEDNIQYFVVRHLHLGNVSSVLVSGLMRDHYYLLVFSLNKSGLPFRFPVNPRKEAIINVSTITDTGDDHTRPMHLKEFKPSGGRCFECEFWPNSTASHCAVIVHTRSEILVSLLFERSGDRAGGCIDIEADGQYDAVVFGYINGVIHGHPYKARILIQDPVEEKGTQGVWLIVTFVMALVVVVVALSIIIPSACVGRKCYLNKNTGINVPRHRVDGDDEQVELCNVVNTQSAPSPYRVKLETVTSMKELLSCFRDESPDWSVIRDELIALGKRELAGEVYTRFLLPKLGEQQQDDSGRFTQTTSTSADSKLASGDDCGEGSAPEEDTKEDRFGGAQSESGRTGVSSVIVHIPEPDLDESESERTKHEQATDTIIDIRDYTTNLRQQNLSTNPIPEETNYEQGFN